MPQNTTHLTLQTLKPPSESEKQRHQRDFHPWILHTFEKNYAEKKLMQKRKHMKQRNVSIQKHIYNREKLMLMRKQN